MSYRYHSRFFKKLFQKVGLKQKNIVLIDSFDLKAITKLIEVSNYLNRCNISNIIVDLAIKNSTELIYPAVIEKSGVFYLLLNKSTEGITIYNPIKNREAIISFEEFKNIFSTNIILLEKINTDYDYVCKYQNCIKKFNVSKYIVVIGVVFIFLAIVNLILFNVLFPVYLLLINLVGMGLTSAYFLKEHDIENVAFEFICTSNGETSSCVSEKEKNVSSIPFSKLGLVFFLTNTIALIVLYEQSHLYLPLLYLLTTGLSIPFILGSIYLQIIKTKQVCKICLLIIIMLILNILVLLIDTQKVVYDFTFEMNLGMMIIGFISLCLVYISSFYLKIHKKHSVLKNKYDSLWTNKDIIEMLLIEQSGIVFSNNRSLSIGNKEAKWTVDLIMHASCKYCQEAFWHLGNLVLMNDNFKLSLHVKYEYIETNQNMMIHFIAACKEGDLIEAHSILRAWKLSEYKEVAVNKFDTCVELNDSFFKTNNIQNFPTILINEKVIPNFIDYENIKLAFV